MEAGLAIGDVVRVTGVDAPTLRRWETHYGLLRPQRTMGGQRRYRPEDVERIRAVLALVEEGWSRADAARSVAERCAAAAAPPEPPPIDVTVFDSVPAGVVVTNSNYEIVYINEHLAKLLGTTPQAMEFTLGYEFLDEAGVQQVTAAFEALRRGDQLEYDLRGHTADGIERTFSVAAGPLLSPTGAYRGAVGIMRDITDQRSIERQLHLHDHLLDAVGEAIVAIDLDGNVVYWNPEAERQFGWSADEVLGRPSIDYTPPEVVDHLREMGARVLEGETCATEVRARRRDGSSLDMRVTLSLFTDDAGQPAGIISVNVDISDRKRAEEESRARATYHEVVAFLSQQALASDDVEGLLAQAVAGVSRALDADYVAVIAAAPGSDELIVRASSHHPGADSPAGALSAPFKSHAAFTIRSQQAVVVDDFGRERRFERGPSTGELAATSGACVPIRRGTTTYGALCVHTATARSYDSSEVTFLQSVANICGLASNLEGRRA